MPTNPRNPLDDRAAGLSMLGSIVFCAITGTGVGVFLERPEVGALAGATIGILVGLWMVPGLRRDRR